MMNMVQLTRVSEGHPVQNWDAGFYFICGTSTILHHLVAGDKYLGFSRGNVSFVAMGDVSGQEFYTGLPDGLYCDIIQDCKQTVQVSLHLVSQAHKKVEIFLSPKSMLMVV